MYLYGKDYPTACACYCIGDEHGPYDATFVGEALEHEGSCAYCHHEECGQRYAVGIPSAYCFYSLWQVSRYHAYACHVAANCIQCLLCHCFFMSITQRECKMCGVHVKNRGAGYGWDAFRCFLLLHKFHHRPIVVFGIVYVTQPMTVGLFLEHFHIFGVESADEDV